MLYRYVIAVGFIALCGRMVWCVVRHEGGLWACEDIRIPLGLAVLLAVTEGIRYCSRHRIGVAKEK